MSPLAIPSVWPQPTVRAGRERTAAGSKALVWSTLALGATLLAGCSFDVQQPSTEPTIFIHSVTPIGGNGQIGEPGTILTQALVVEIRATNGLLLSGVPVFWDVTSGGGTLDNDISQTGFDGRTGVQWRLGFAEGAQTATATVEGMTPVTFSATATVGANGTGF